MNVCSEKKTAYSFPAAQKYSNALNVPIFSLPTEFFSTFLTQKNDFIFVITFF